jgi:hypothetical protein
MFKSEQDVPKNGKAFDSKRQPNFHNQISTHQKPVKKQIDIPLVTRG